MITHNHRQLNLQQTRISAPPDRARFFLRSLCQCTGEWDDGFVAGFLPDATPDPVWGSASVPTGEWSQNPLGNLLAVDSGARVYVSDTDPDLAGCCPRGVLRLTGNGPPDPTWFATTGDLTFDILLGAIQWPGVAEKLIVAGTIDNAPAIGRFDL